MVSSNGGKYKVCKFDRITDICVVGLTPFRNVGRDVDQNEELIGVCWKEVGSDLLIIIRIGLEIYRALNASKSAKQASSAASGLLGMLDMDEAELVAIASDLSRRSEVEDAVVKAFRENTAPSADEGMHQLAHRLTGATANTIIKGVTEATGRNPAKAKVPKIEAVSASFDMIVDQLFALETKLAIDCLVFFKELGTLEVTADAELSTDEVWLLEAEARLGEKTADYWPSKSQNGDD